MRQHKMLTRTLLVLSIINFALAAPAAVRERPEVRSPAPTSTPDYVSGHTPPSSPDSDNILSQISHTDSPALTPTPDSVSDHTSSSPGWDDILSQISNTDSPTLTPTPDYVPPSPELTDILSRIQYADRPALTPTPDHVPDHTPPSSPDWENLMSQIYSPAVTPTPDYVPDHTPPPGPDLENLLSQISYIDSPTLSPTPDYVPEHTAPPSPDLADILSQIPHADTPPPPPPPPPHPNQPGLKYNHFPPGFGPPPPLPYPSQSGPSKDPTLSQNPGIDLDLHSLRDPEFFSVQSWAKFLKGKFKRRISGSDAANLAQKDTRSRVF